MLSTQDIESITEAELENLISSGVPESLTLEYKMQPYGNSDSDKKEFLKDISALANQRGGHLIIGLKEEEGIPTHLVGSNCDPDKELLRMESLVRDGIQPRIFGIRMLSVKLKKGGHAFVLRIPTSYNRPHRVVFKNSNRFFSRTSSGVFEMDVEELRGMFISSNEALDKARKFHEGRVKKIAVGDGILPTTQGLGTLVIHTIPLTSAGGGSLDIAKAVTDEKLRPIGATSWGRSVNYDGVIAKEGHEQFDSYTQIYRSGTLEAVQACILGVHREVQVLPAQRFGKDLIEFFPKYLELLNNLETPYPLAVFISVTGVTEAILGYSNSSFSFSAPQKFGRDCLNLLETIVEKPLATNEGLKILRPAFDVLWNGAGLTQCTYFDDKGNWAPHG